MGSRHVALDDSLRIFSIVSMVQGLKLYSLCNEGAIRDWRSNDGEDIEDSMSCNDDLMFLILVMKKSLKASARERGLW